MAGQAASGQLAQKPRHIINASCVRLVAPVTSNSCDTLLRTVWYERNTRSAISRIYKLLGANGRREVVRRAKESGLYEA